jgi:cobalamin synthase
MKTLIGAVIVLIAVFFLVPMVVGGSTNLCQAVEQHNVSKTASNIAGGSTGPVYGVINTIGQAGATGQATSMAETNAHPNTPTPISCAISFWKTL